MNSYDSADILVDSKVVRLAVLMHDMADNKFCDNKEKALIEIKSLLDTKTLNDEQIEKILIIIQFSSFSGGNNEQYDFEEFKIVQDADRLDAIGAIGIARTFGYGGHKKRPIYDPSIPPIEYENKEAYYKSDAPTINHFYEKLLKLKDLMKTSKGKELAEERHQFMKTFLKQFYKSGVMAYRSYFERAFLDQLNEFMNKIWIKHQVLLLMIKIKLF